MRFLRLLIATFISLLAISTFAFAEDIVVKGSDTMVILGQKWAEVYMKKNKNVVIQVTGGGSGTGIAALINKTTDLANASRPIKTKEKEQIEASGEKLIEIPVAFDGLAVYLNRANPINQLDLKTLKDIYTGKIRNWKELGWEDKTIKLYSRENNSGTYVYFKEHVLENEDYSPLAQSLPGTAAVLNAVKKDKYGIGYGGIAYLKGAKAIKVSVDKNSEAYEPTMENVLNGKYPISRYLYIYTTDKTLAKPEVKAYLSWILSEEGQKVVSEVGYYPLPKKILNEIREKIGL
ncbi:MAG: PstS family phosphate ABC transporter substrate-binding protein [Brevinematia bacterium]